MKYRILPLVITLLLSSVVSMSQEQQKTDYEVVCVGFYNLENLFDTINGENRDDEFTPNATKKWNTARYNEKLFNMAKVISQIATDVTPDGPAILGVSEIENRTVLEDLVKQESIKDRNYQVAHFDSPDKRGVDVGLLYNPSYFEVTNMKSECLSIYKKDKKSGEMMKDTTFFSRDQLVVSGLLKGEKMHFIVGHWPSRRGGEAKSEPLRIAAGKLARKISDSILAEDKNAKIIIMGDLNDTPNNKSVTDYLKATDDKSKLSEGYFFNPFQTKENKGEGSQAYRDEWSMLDQVILTPAFIQKDKEFKDFSYYQARIFKKNFMLTESGSFKGYPKRSFVGNSWKGGYSDHFPVYVILIRETKK